MSGAERGGCVGSLDILKGDNTDYVQTSEFRINQERYILRLQL
jgi:hypothetical protein